MPHADIIHCRLPPETLKRLDRQLALLKKTGTPMTRSKLVRQLLSTQLEADPNAIAVHNAFHRSDALMERIAELVTAEVVKTLPDVVSRVAGTIGAQLQTADTAAEPG